MTLQEALSKISSALAVLAHKTYAENLAGLFSLNRLAEDLLLPVFRLALSAPRMRNVNWDLVNFPHIDLADDESRVAVQVTTERGEAKVSETLANFIQKKYQRNFDRLVFFVFTNQRLRYAAKTKKKWKRICARKFCFDSGTDIITTLDLYKIIARLPEVAIFSLHDIIARSVIGAEFVDVQSVLKGQSERQLDYEKKSGKYIPNIFVETRETKNLARSFSHPTLFFGRALESLGRLNVSARNRFLAKAGLPPLPFPNLSRYYGTQSLLQVGASAGELSAEFLQLTDVLGKYEKVSLKNPPPFKVKKGRQHFFEQNTHVIQSGLGWGMKYHLRDLLDDLKVVKSRIFFLTGRAGQGKTNLVCDFVENFLWKHGVPCAYLSGRTISLMQTMDICDAIQKLIFDGKTNSFSEAADLLSAHADRAGKPFVLIIDGLNEHPRVTEFADQLGDLIGKVLRYPHLKLFLTCRSEFFKVRFGRLVETPFDSHTFLLEANETRLEKKWHDEVLVGYFKFFQVQRKLVSDQVVESLKKDMLLLRFFCEAYGAKGKPDGYQQPWIANIYRGEIFKTYLENKLGTADLFLRRVTGKVNPIDPKADLRNVLESCVERMLQSWQFGNVPVSVVPQALNEALYALLDEELILRRDAPPGASIFSPSEETINFTFDELRDFLLAEYLLHRVYVADRPTFEQYIARNDPKDSQIIEGIKKFLFYASRRKSNDAFWTYYRHQPWYMDVYDREIFNIDTELLRDEDRELVEAALRTGGERGCVFSRHLAVRWHAGEYPHLNLGLLLSVVTKGDDLQFDNLIMNTFKAIGNYNEGSSAHAFSQFITEKVLPKFRANNTAAQNLFRFLILLLPVDSGVDLNSDADTAFRKLLELHQTYGIALLRESLQFKPTRHRAHVWRLLTSASKWLEGGDPLFAEAQQEMAASPPTSSVIRREAVRFLERCDQTTTVIAS